MFLPFILIKNRIVKVFFLAVFLFPLIRLMRNLSLSICCHESYGDVPTEILTFLLLFTVVIIAILPKYKIPIAFLYVVCTVYVFYNKYFIVLCFTYSFVCFHSLLTCFLAEC